MGRLGAKRAPRRHGQHAARGLVTPNLRRRRAHGSLQSRTAITPLAALGSGCQMDSRRNGGDCHRGECRTGRALRTHCFALVGIHPAENTYVQETTPAVPPIMRGSGPEVFAMLGGRLKARAYNAFLQGQFRNSDYCSSNDQVNHVLGEAWAGVEFRTTGDWEFR